MGRRFPGGPASTRSVFYDVQAEAGSGADSQQMRLMIRTLLADRFQLKLHRETRAIAGYVLNVDKGGPKSPPASTDVPPDRQAVQILPGRGIVSRAGTRLDGVVAGAWDCEISGGETASLPFAG